MNRTAIFLSAALLAASGLVFAHDGAVGVVKERMQAMKDMSTQSKLVAKMFKGKTEFDKAALMEAAELFTTHGAKMDELFADTEMSRTGSETEALPLIWQEREDFTELVVEFFQSSEELKIKVGETDDVKVLRKAYFRAAKNCRSCHKRFRKPKE